MPVTKVSIECRVHVLVILRTIGSMAGEGSDWVLARGHRYVGRSAVSIVLGQSPSA